MRYFELKLRRAMTPKQFIRKTSWGALIPRRHRIYRETKNYAMAFIKFDDESGIAVSSNPL